MFHQIHHKRNVLLKKFFVFNCSIQCSYNSNVPIHSMNRLFILFSCRVVSKGSTLLYLRYAHFGTQ